MLDSVERWIVFVHVASAFVFAAGHGVSIFVAFRLRRERDPNRMGALLDISSYALNFAGIGLLVLLVSGIAAGWLLGSFGRGWIWVSIALLIAVAVLMTPIGTVYYAKVRAGLGQRTRQLKRDDPDPIPIPQEELEALLRSRRPELLLLIGGGGFLVILWLMMFRPF